MLKILYFFSIETPIPNTARQTLEEANHGKFNDPNDPNGKGSYKELETFQQNTEQRKNHLQNPQI